MGALDGLREALARSADTVAVFAESSPEALIAALRAHGLDVFVCDEEARRLVPWSDTALQGTPYVNLYAATAAP